VQTAHTNSEFVARWLHKRGFLFDVLVQILSKKDVVFLFDY